MITLWLPAGKDVDCPFVSGCCQSCELLASPGCAILVVIAVCSTLHISCCGSLMKKFRLFWFSDWSAGSDLSIPKWSVSRNFRNLFACRDFLRIELYFWWWYMQFYPGSKTCINHITVDRYPDGVGEMNFFHDGILLRNNNVLYPYHFFLRETSNFSLRFNLYRLVSPFWLLILGRTYGTYLHYERTYTTNVPTL